MAIDLRAGAKFSHLPLALADHQERSSEWFSVTVTIDNISQLFLTWQIAARLPV
jgi:hypothetical protein